MRINLITPATHVAECNRDVAKIKIKPGLAMINYSVRVLNLIA
jgi:hypothetical protein